MAWIVLHRSMWVWGTVCRSKINYVTAVGGAEDFKKGVVLTTGVLCICTVKCAKNTFNSPDHRAEWKAV
jgi:hypothetical protein